MLGNSLAPLLSAERGTESLALAIIDRQTGLTPAKALQSPQLSALAAVAPGDTAEALGNLITFTASQFNVVRNLTEVQVALLANDLLERYWHWKIDEFVYLCREAIAGRWGKAYDRIDPPTVHSWCLAYAEVRDALLADAAQLEAKQHKQAEKTTTRFANEQEVRRYLEQLSDAELEYGIAYYGRHPEEPQADVKAQLAAETLLDRKRLALLRSVVLSEDSTYAEEVSEEEYRRFRAEYVANRAQQANEAEQQDPEASAA